jgi:hypothetical protein
MARKTLLAGGTLSYPHFATAHLLTPAVSISVTSGFMAVISAFSAAR